MKDYERLVNWESTRAASENAKRIFNAAVMIGNAGNYGLGTSLMILSREEAQKSLLMAFVTSGLYDVQSDGIQKELENCFLFHKYKLTSSWLVSAFVAYFIGGFEEGLIKNNFPPEIIENFLQFMQQRVDNLRRLAREGTKTLDTFKNAGLYVGPNDLYEWFDPIQIPQDTFSQLKSSTAFHLLTVSLVISIFKKGTIPEDWKHASMEFRRIIAERPRDPSSLKVLEQHGQLGEILAGFWRFLQKSNLIEAYESAGRLPPL
ncbi:MAG: AbiV family abortive infection protein [Candidatus Thorarchaeota archaeon]|jgi:AbiV family abortive infection protein